MFGSFTIAFTQLVLNDQLPSENVSKDKTEASKASVAEHKASSSKIKKRKYVRDGFGIQSERVSRRRPKRGKNDSNREPKGKCFHCGVDGHWKRNCNKYLSELKEKKKGKFDLLVLEANLVEVDSQSWIIDSGSTNHICSSLQMLSSSRELADGECSIVVRNGAEVSAIAVGAVRLELGNKFLVLNNVYCIPGFRRNLISVSKLYEQLFVVSFYNN